MWAARRAEPLYGGHSGSEGGIQAYGEDQSMLPDIVIIELARDRHAALLQEAERDRLAGRARAAPDISRLASEIRRIVVVWPSPRLGTRPARTVVAR